MKLVNKSLLLGVGAGIALTLVTLDVLGRRYQQDMLVVSMPTLLRPLNQLPTPRLPESSAQLPRPWLPRTSAVTHDKWQMRSPDGKTTKLNDLMGKAVFLDFWATYCGPCLAEMPGIERLAGSLKTENVAFAAVTGEKLAPVQEFLRKNCVAIPIYLADEEPPPDLSNSVLPTVYILDRNGRAVYRSQGAQNWDDDNARSFLRALARQ